LLKKLYFKFILSHSTKKNQSKTFQKIAFQNTILERGDILHSTSLTSSET